MTVAEQNAEMAALAKATLRANPMMGATAKCNVGLGLDELTLTVITLANGKTIKCWNESKGITVRGLARRERQEVAKVEFVIAHRVTKEVLLVKQTFALVGNDLVPA